MNGTKTSISILIYVSHCVMPDYETPLQINLSDWLFVANEKINVKNKTAQKTNKIIYKRKILA